MALGASPLLLRLHGIACRSIRSRDSLTIPIADASLAPESTVMDESYKIAITRLGDRIRVGGMAEISGYNNRLEPARRRTLEHSVSDLFPGGDLSQATFWSGLRPMTPDGTPVIGATPVRGLYLNTGPAPWAGRCPPARRVIADMVSGRVPDRAPRTWAIPLPAQRRAARPATGPGPGRVAPPGKPMAGREQTRHCLALTRK